MHRLAAVVPAPRLHRYRAACAGTSTDPIDLYRWSGSVALAVFDDLGTVEIAMRSAMAHELSAEFGSRWFERADLLDDGTAKLIRSAWSTARLDKLEVADEVVHGKLVATLMFGFWVKILGRGAKRTSPDGTQARRIYDTVLWKPALRRAFPGAGALDRAHVEATARRVQALRNRIAHHEHIVWGVPLPGEKDSNGEQVRLSLREAHENVLRLAGFVDAGLESWMREYSAVFDRLAACPVADPRRFHL